MMSQLHFNSRACAFLVLYSILLDFLPGISSAGVVTLQSIQIFNTHEWLNAKPTVYFHCQGENKTILPDVKKSHYLYTFKGEESWQPLTELADKKCKRCGFYEKNTLKSDDVFDEWELCPSDFTAPDGKYVSFKEKEFNATFLCPQCMQEDKGSSHNSDLLDRTSKKKGMIFVIVISVLAVLVSTLGAVAAYRYWQKKKKARDQARFLKLFEDDDDIEDELGLGHVI